MEESLQETADRLHAIVESAVDGILAIDIFLDPGLYAEPPAS